MGHTSSVCYVLSVVEPYLADRRAARHAAPPKAATRRTHSKVLAGTNITPSAVNGFRCTPGWSGGTVATHGHSPDKRLVDSANPEGSKLLAAWALSLSLANPEGSKPLAGG